MNIKRKEQINKTANGTNFEHLVLGNMKIPSYLFSKYRLLNVKCFILDKLSCWYDKRTDKYCQEIYWRMEGPENKMNVNELSQEQDYIQ